MHIYAPADRPFVEVLHGEVWYPGLLRGWWDRDGERLLNVEWTVSPGETYIETVGVGRVREISEESRPASP